MALNPAVWGPHYWFFLHTIAMTYPQRPNAITKKKYYEFLMNLPLFIPNETIARNVVSWLDAFPVSAYLDSRDDLVKWMHFLHNHVNQTLHKPPISLQEFYRVYHEAYKAEPWKQQDQRRWREKMAYAALVAGLVGVAAFLYRQQG